MTSLLFVHGAGVRDTGLQEYVSQLRAGLARIRPGIEVRVSAWGEAFDTGLLYGGICVPDEPGRQRFDMVPTRSLLEKPADDARVELWGLLDSAPLAELDTVLAHAGQVPDRRDENLARTVADRLGEGLNPGTALERALAAAGLRTTAMAAATQLVASDQFAELTAARIVEPARQAACLARAFIALAIQLRDEELGGPAPLDGSGRERLESTAAQVLAGPETAPGRLHPHLRGTASDDMLQLAANWSARNRLRLTRTGFPGLADLLKYLANGAALRRWIRAELRAIDDEQVIVVAHGLGAVAAMDLLIETPEPNVAVMVAIASHSGLLFELDAMPTARSSPDYRPPAGFPATHFIYDPRDLLAFKSGGLFGPGITDHKVDNRAPFPRNHGAYFANTEVHELLDRFLPY